MNIKKAITGVILGVFFTAVFFCVASSPKYSTTNYRSLEEYYLELPDLWEKVSDTKADLVIPSDAPDNLLLSFRSAFIISTVYFDGEPILDSVTLEEESCYYTYWHKLSGECAGHVLSVETDSAENLEAVLSEKSVLGSSGYLVLRFIQSNVYVIIYALFCLISAVLVFVFLIWCKVNRLEGLGNYVLYLAIFILLTGLEILTDSQFLTLFLKNETLVSVANFIAITVMPCTMLSFMNSYYDGRHPVMRILSLLSLSLSGIMLLIWLIFRVPLFRYLPVFHSILVISVILAGIDVIQEYKENKELSNTILLLSVLELIIGAAVTVISYYFDPTGPFVMYMTVCVFLFVVLLFGSAGIKIQTQLKNASADRRTALEQARRSAEAASTAKTSLVRSISYSIRMPMNSAIGYAELAKNHMNDREIVEGSLRKIQNAGGQVIELLDELMSIYGNSDGNIEINEKPVDMIRTFQTVVDVAEGSIAGRNIRLEADCNYIADRYAFGDKTHLDGILMTLLNNAIRRCGSGDRITCEFREERSPSDGYGSYILLVEDTGREITADEIQQINGLSPEGGEAYVRERHSTVISLSIYKQIVELMGGIMDIYSSPAEGTRITVNLDLKKASKEEYEAYDEKRAVRTDSAAGEDELSKIRGKRVLIVDDSEQSVDLLTTVLSDLGVESEHVGDGSLAVEAVRNAEEHYYDLILMDIVMPYMDGHKATAMIRSMGNPVKAATPIVCVSADAYIEDRERILSEGMQDMLPVPINRQDLVRILLKYA